MTKLPTTSPQQIVKALLRTGFEAQHQIGTHVAFCDAERKRKILVPLHAVDLHRELVERILKQG